MARVVLIRPGSSEQRVEDMEGATRECGSRPEGSARPCQGQLFGSARKVLRGRRGRRSQARHVRVQLPILEIHYDFEYSRYRDVRSDAENCGRFLNLGVIRDIAGPDRCVNSSCYAEHLYMRKPCSLSSDE